MTDPRLREAMQNIQNIAEQDAAHQAEIIRNLDRLLKRLEMEEEDLSKQTQSERTKLSERLSDFDCENSQAWQLIKQKGWDELSQKILLSIASIIANKCQIGLDREAKRRKPILIKWFQENLKIISPAIDKIYLEYRDG